MYKRFLRCVSMILVLTMLTEMLSIIGLDLFSQKVAAVDHEPESAYSMPAPAESPNITPAKAPDVIIDKTKRMQSTDTDSIDANRRYITILSGYTRFSQLSPEDAAFFADFTGAESETYAALEQQGLGLDKSVTCVRLISDFGCSVSQSIEFDLSNDELCARLTQLSIYRSLLNDAFTGSTYDFELRSWILKGYSAEQVLNAYGAHMVFGIEIGALLEADDDKSMPTSLNSEEVMRIQEFSNALGIEAIPVAEYTVKNSLPAAAIEAERDAIEQQKAQIMIRPQSVSEDNKEPTEAESRYLDAPYTYSSGDQEKVALNSGALEIVTEDYVLPGVNGLDLVIGRQYNSQNASSRTPCVEMGVYSEYAYYVLYGCKASYYVPGVGTGSWSYYDEEHVAGPFKTYATATEFAGTLPTGTYRYPNFRDGADLILSYYVAVQSIVIGQGTYEYSSTKYNNYLNGLYGLGHGWSFRFSSIENDENKQYLHTEDGSTYEIDFSASGSHLKDYLLLDMVLDNDYTAFYNDAVSSKYRLRYQNGKCEYFSDDGKLIGIQDRYGNTIKLIHSISAGYPYITIIDTLGNTTTISGQDTTGGHVMTVSLPDNSTLQYVIKNDGDLAALASYIDVMGEATQYSYSKQTVNFDALNKFTDAASYDCLNLTTVTHPTGAQSLYTYAVTERNLGKDGLTQAYRITSRKDSVGSTYANCQNYSYSASDCSGYPEISDADQLPEEFHYSTTVENLGGAKTEIIFNSKHLKESVAISSDGMLLQKNEYVYNADKLPVKETLTAYNPSAASAAFTTVTATEYDSAGRVVANWLPQVDGNTEDEEHVVRCIYDSTYGMLLTKTWKTDASTTVKLQNTLDAAKKQIIRSEVYRNDTLTARTEYTYDDAGNVISERRYHDDMTSCDLTQYSYDRNAFLSQEIHSGLLTADGDKALSSPGRMPGEVVTSYTYDLLGHMLTATDGNGNCTSYTYDATGNVTDIVNPDDSTRSYARDYAANNLTVTDENGTKLKYTYTPLGLPQETVDVQSGLVLQQKKYDSQSRLTNEVDYVYGTSIKYEYDALDRVVSESAVQGSEILSKTLYSYDDAAENGSYQKVTKTVMGDDAAPSVVTTEYTDKNGNVAKTGKFLNGVEYFDIFTYDYQGNRISVLTAADAAKNLPFTSKYAYNESNQETSVTNAEGFSSTNRYNSLGQLVESADYAGTPTTYRYDSLGRLLSQTILIDAGITAVTKYDYDACGNIIREWKPVNAERDPAAWAKTEFSYNSRGKLIAVQQYDGASVASETAYAYDAAGNLLQMSVGGSTTTYTYDRFGNVLTETNALGQTKSNSYSTVGRLESTTSQGGVVTTYGYDALGRVVQTVASKGDMQQVLQRSYTSTGQIRTEENGNQRTTYTYDSLGRAIRVDETALHDGLPSITVNLDAAGGEVTPSSVSVAAYDVYDLPVPTRFGYTFMGWYLGQTLISNGDPVELTEDTTFVAKWQKNGIIVLLDAAGGSVDALGVVIREDGQYTLPTPSREGFTFDGWYLGDTLIPADGSIPITEDCTLTAHWTAITYTVIYHGNGGYTQRIKTEITRTYRGGQAVDMSSLGFKWFGDDDIMLLGWRTSPIYNKGTFYALDVAVYNLASSDGEVIDLYAEWYDPNQYGRPVEPEKPWEQYTAQEEIPTNITAASTDYTKNYTYDLAGNRTGFQLVKRGKVVQDVTYAYDNLNRLAVVSENGRQATYTYDANGNRLTLTYANGAAETYRYNKANWLTSIMNRNADDLVSLFNYTYYASGSRKSKADAAGAVTEYIYDDLNRLTQEIESGGLTRSYTYDAAGNRAQLTVTGTENYVTSYTYDEANRLQSETRTGGDSSNTLYTYDADGNLLTYIVTKAGGTASGAFQYDAFGQLLQFSAGGTWTAYAYNAQGIRTEKTTADGWTQYLLDGKNVVGEQTRAGLVTYLRGANLISRRSGEELNYYLFDAHGDVTELIDSAGAVTHSYRYNAFGEEKDPDPEDTNPFRYCGEYYDAETGTYYLRARHYDPQNGRFTQQDTHWNTANSIYGDNPQRINEREDGLGLKTYTYVPQISAIMQSGNLYVYCINNPIALCDLLGEAATRGQIHNWVVYDIAFKYKAIGMRCNMLIDYPSGGYGFADLINIVTREVWEVKRVTLKEPPAVKQLDRYIAGSIRRENGTGRKLEKGGTITTIPKADIIRIHGDTIYHISYWTVLNEKSGEVAAVKGHSDIGIVWYDYTTKKINTEEVTLLLMTLAGIAGITMLSGGLASGVGAAAGAAAMGVLMGE